MVIYIFQNQLYFYTPALNYAYFTFCYYQHYHSHRFASSPGLAKCPSSLKFNATYLFSLLQDWSRRGSSKLTDFNHLHCHLHKYLAL